MPIKVEMTDLRQLVRETVAAWRPAADARRVGLTVETGVVPAAAGDRERLAPLFDHLISNAIGHAPEGGRVSVRLYEQDGWAQAEVQNASTTFSFALPLEHSLLAG